MNSLYEALKSYFDVKNIKFLGNSPNSLLFKVKTTNQSIFVKKYKFKAQFLQDEFENQQEAYNILSRGPVRVPKPLFYDEKENILAMEFVEGESLTTFLRKNNLYFHKQLTDIYKKIGKGLKKIHERPVRGVHVEKLIFENILERKSSFSSIAKSLFQKGEIVRLHGNFKCENILVNNKYIYFLDFSYNYKGSPLYDIAKFLESTFTAGFRNPHIIFYRFNTKNIKEALLKGYGVIDEGDLKKYRAVYKTYDLLNARKRFGRSILSFIYWLRFRGLLQ